MAGAFEIVMQERKTLVDKIIGMMKQGDFFHNASEWDRAALRPQNPLSKVWYRGGNRMKLMAVVTERGYRDPRWATAKQLFEKCIRLSCGCRIFLVWLHTMGADHPRKTDQCLLHGQKAWSEDSQSMNS